MKKNVLALSIIGVALYLLTSCSAPISITPTTAPTETQTLTLAPTKTNSPEPTPTQTPSPTLTPTNIPTLAFYAVNPTIGATAESCKDLPDTICVSGVTILLSGRKLGKYEVTVSYPGFSGTSFECHQKALLVSFGDNMAPVFCDQDEINFMSVGLTEMTITISWDGGTVTQTVSPRFEIDTPQGPDCWPKCVIGIAEINIP